MFKMKLITFAVPSYNSAGYMNRCIDSLLRCATEEEIEIIIIDDGSTDETGAIADEYQAKYPKIVRAIHQSNGGHGAGVNTGLHHASGLYYKVVDSDDWLDPAQANALFTQMRLAVYRGEMPDLFICNYVYEHVDDGTRRPIRYNGTLPEGEPFSWKATRAFKPWQYLLMHSLFYRTQLLRDCHLHLPEHTFYVDNLYAFVPLPLVKKMMYINADVYRYFIGRQDQSVNEKVMVRRVDQQLTVTKRMILAYHAADFSESGVRCMHYMRNYMSMMMTICSILLLLDGSSEAMGKKADLWRFLQETDTLLYQHIRYHSIASFTLLPGRLGRYTVIELYRFCNRFFKFN